MRTSSRTTAGLIATVFALALVFTGCSSDSTDDSDGADPTTTAPDGSGDTSSPPTTAAPLPAALDLLPLHAVGGEQPAFVDEAGRQVLLRGVNVIGWGDYYQADPDLPATIDITDADWDAMAAQGFSVVRLIVSWSALEPAEGEYDEAYIEQLHEAVDAASARGIYVVLDMHQDAWGKYIATPEGYECPEGLEPAIGWDGAPEWATITDDTETCRNPGSRESALAVRTAFQNFYDDRDGIRTAFVTAWAHLAGSFADDPAVAGYDLLNEPNVVEATTELQPKYTELILELIAAIRTAEAEAGGFEHVMFVEPLVLFPAGGTVPPAGFTEDGNIAFAPHNYWEAISMNLFTVEQGFGLNKQAAAGLDAPYWIGEYGWWDTSPETLERLRRYAAAEDEARVGGAWWQWRQACGDPHSIGVPGNEPDDQTHLNAVACPSGEDLGLTEEFAVVLSRAYPRAAPGRLTELVSDPDTRTMRLTGTATGAEEGAQLVVWVPDADKGEPSVGGTGFGETSIEPWAGGFVISTVVDPEYTLTIDGE